jgi:hypothetical protein
MFGMLDYRAHKLYWLLSLPLVIVLRLLALFALPFAEYAIGISLAHERLWQIAITIAVIFPVELLWFLFHKTVDVVFGGIFNFLIDVIPADGRSHDDAKLVVKGGDEAIAVWHIDNTDPNEWSEELIRAGTKGTSVGRIFAHRRLERFFALKDHYINNPDIERSEYTAEEFLRGNNMWPSLIEEIANHPIYRFAVFQYSFLLWLLAAHPLAN